MVKVFFTWWYTLGWAHQIERIKYDLRFLANFFSIKLLCRTLFSPFHQISANDQGRFIGDKISAWFSRGFSRVYGAIVRTFTILFGIFALLLTVIWSIIRLIGWAIMPFTVIIYVVIALMGWAPWI